MKKTILPLVILIFPAALLWLLFKCAVSYIIANTTDYSLIGQQISEAVPYVLMVNHTIALLTLILALRLSSLPVKEVNRASIKTDIFLGLSFGLILFAFQQLALLPILTKFNLFSFHGGFPGYPYFISAVIFAAIVEEFIYRDYGMKALGQLGVNPILCSIITTFFFCLLHYGQGWAGIINAAYLGFGLSFLYLRRQSLISNIFAHGIFNFMVLISMTVRS